MTQLDRPAGGRDAVSDALSGPFTPGMRDNPEELAVIPDEIARALEVNHDPTPTEEFTEQWRNASYNCFSSGHKFCREVCPVMQVTRNESWTPTAFHANVVAMDKGELTIEEVASDYVNCTQCGACELRCPNTLFTGDFYRFRTRTVDVVKAVRAFAVEQGVHQPEWQTWNARTDDRTHEPVLGETPVSQEHVRDWSEGLDLPIGGETVLFVDCEAAFYRTSVPRAVAQILQQAGYEFGLMGEQWCCGGPAAEMGYVDQAKRFAQHNLDNWRSTGTTRVLVLDPHDYISFTEDYPKYFGDDYDIEVVLVVELFAELIREGRLTPSVPIERAITYHDPCRLNKRKGIWKEPREILRAIPGLDFSDVDRVTQWSYCSGGGGGLPVEKPELTAAISDSRLGKAKALEVDTLVSACPWSERPADRGRRQGRHRRGRHPRAARGVARHRGRRFAGSRAMTIAPERVDELVTALRTVLRDEQILTSKTDRYNRARVPAPFPVHRWAERLPDLAVLPTSTEEVAGVVRIANELRVPVVPRDGGTGLTDGAVPLHGGIVVDVKRMNQVKELDLENRTVTVGTGISMLKLNEELGKHGLFYPDDPASYPCSLVGGRIGTSGWSLIGSRYGHTRDLVLSFDHVLPTGEVMHVGDGIGHKITKSSSGYQLKHLFMGHQGTLGIATEATLKLFPKPEAELSPFWAFDNYDDAYRCVGALARAGVATFAGAVLFDEYKVAYLRRDDEAYIPQPSDVRALVCAVMYGYEDEVRPAGRRLFRIAKEHGARYLGDEISEGDWAARHDRYATPLHGRTKAGQVVPMSWHCEDAAVNYTNLPSVSRAWHEIVADLRRRTDVFDDWGMFTYTSGNTGVDYLTEIDVGIWEQQLDDRAWEMWVKAKRDIAAVALAHHGSISACHGSCREGEVDLVPDELGRGYDLMLDLKRTLDPNNIMNPGKYLLDRAYEPSKEQGNSP